ncbi:MAG: thioesterase family protein [Clostridia bacterium]|nr:thioesterase family protein [Clostridia bacterium]MBO5439742.1 thioesterase family protein [Clostridia bacterium]
MEIGAKFKVTIKVEEKDTAKAHGSGTLAVLATPRMIALMEESAYKCIDKYLEEGQSSVGTYLDVKHLSATPVGMEVYAESEIIDVDGRRVVFSVKAYDDKGLIGEGKHERFIVFSEKFVAKTYQKLDK